jgi:hypothetical protein
LEQLAKSCVVPSSHPMTALDDNTESHRWGRVSPLLRPLSPGQAVGKLLLKMRRDFVMTPSSGGCSSRFSKTHYCTSISTFFSRLASDYHGRRHQLWIFTKLTLCWQEDSTMKMRDLTSVATICVKSLQLLHKLRTPINLTHTELLTCGLCLSSFAVCIS